jgi:hypothetical protein
MKVRQTTTAASVMRMNETWQAGVLLPENDPVASEDEKKNKKTRWPNDGAKIAHDLEHTRRRFVARLARIAEEKEDQEKHRENAERGNTKNSLKSKVSVRPICDKGTGGAADINHGVVDGIPEGADIFLGSTSGGAHDARLYQCDAKSGENQDNADEQAGRNCAANRREP